MRNHLTNYILLTVEVRDFAITKTGYEDLLSLVHNFFLLFYPFYFAKNLTLIRDDKHFIYDCPIQKN
jgi:hypothetical protein